MKTTVFSLCVSMVSALMVCADVPKVESVEFIPLYGGSAYKVTYRLTGDSAIVTADFQTNTLSDASGEWVSVGGKAQRRVGGDVNRWIEKPSIEDAKLSLYWFPEDDWAGKTLPAAQVRCKVSAWTTNDPPDVMVLDLRESARRMWYPGLDYLPDGIEGRKYKGRYYPMRRIHAKDVTWVMGACKGDVDWHKAGNFGTEELTRRAHKVRLTCDYYIGVYEFTEKHHEYAVTRTCFAQRSGTHLPKQGMNFNKLRGSGVGYGWPVYTNDGMFDYDQSHKVEESSVIAKIRAATGLDGLDLPTEAQWEFACRAGVSGPLYSGESYTAEHLGKIARYSGNQNAVDCEGLTEKRATVGTYKPNSWGIFDMLGNLREYVLDRYETMADVSQTDVYIDPVGAKANGVDDKRVVRGGYYNQALSSSSIDAISSSVRNSASPTPANIPYALRLALDIGRPSKPAVEPDEEVQGEIAWIDVVKQILEPTPSTYALTLDSEYGFAAPGLLYFFSAEQKFTSFPFYSLKVIVR